MSSWVAKMSCGIDDIHSSTEIHKRAHMCKARPQTIKPSSHESKPMSKPVSTLSVLRKIRDQFYIWGGGVGGPYWSWRKKKQHKRFINQEHWPRRSFLFCNSWQVQGKRITASRASINSGFPRSQTSFLNQGTTCSPNLAQAKRLLGDNDFSAAKKILFKKRNKQKSVACVHTSLTSLLHFKEALQARLKPVSFLQWIPLSLTEQRNKNKLKNTKKLRDKSPCPGELCPVPVPDPLCRHPFIKNILFLTC